MRGALVRLLTLPLKVILSVTDCGNQAHQTRLITPHGMIG
jgi:hypothetical protein